MTLKFPWCCGCCCCCGCTCCSGRCSTKCRVFSLPCLVCLSVCGALLPFSPFCHSASSAPSRVSSTQFPLRTCCPWSTRIHHAFCHHVMCLFDTWHSSCTEFTSSCCLHPGPQLLSLLLSSLLLSTHFSLAPPELWRLLRSPVLSRLLRSPVLSRLLTRLSLLSSSFRASCALLSSSCASRALSSSSRPGGFSSLLLSPSRAPLCALLCFSL